MNTGTRSERLRAHLADLFGTKNITIVDWFERLRWVELDGVTPEQAAGRPGNYDRGLQRLYLYREHLEVLGVGPLDAG